MEVIFIQDTHKNPAYKQIQAITSDYNYIDAYVTSEKLEYFNKLPQAYVGAYIYDQRFEGILEYFELEKLNPKKIKRLSEMDYRLIQFLQTGEYYVPQRLSDKLKKVTVEYFFVRYQTVPPQWFCDFLKEHNIKTKIL